MKWKAEYALGIDEIDRQHREILEFITLFEKMSAEKAHWNEVHPLIVRTREFVKFHFSVEEALMRILRYPDAAAHRAEHQYVLEHIADLEIRVLRTNMTDEVVPLMRHWLFDHIVGSDKQFARYTLDAFDALPKARKKVM